MFTSIIGPNSSFTVCFKHVLKLYLSLHSENKFTVRPHLSAVYYIPFIVFKCTASEYKLNFSAQMVRVAVATSHAIRTFEWNEYLNH